MKRKTVIHLFAILCMSLVLIIPSCFTFAETENQPADNLEKTEININDFQVQNFYSKGLTYKSYQLNWDSVEGADGYNIYKTSLGFGYDIKEILQHATLVEEIESGSITSYTINSSKGGKYFVVPYYIDNEKKVNGVFHVVVGACPINLNKTTFISDNTTPIINKMGIISTECYRYIETYVDIDGTGSKIASMSIELYLSSGGGWGTGIDRKHGENFAGTVYWPVDGTLRAENGGSNGDIGYIAISDQGRNTSYYLPDNATIRILREEFPTEFRGALSNPNIRSSLELMDEGSAVVLTIDKASGGILRKDLLEAIKGKEKTIVVNCNSSGTRQWVFYGKNITGKPKDLNLNVEVEKAEGDIYGTSSNVMKLKFANNGTLPGNVSFRVCALFNGMLDDEGRLYLYYLSGKNIKKEASKCKVFGTSSSKMWAYVDLAHNSTFLLSGSKLSGRVLPTVANAKITGIKSRTYTGKKIKPAPTVKVNGKVLKKGTNYTLSFKNNKSVGKATVIIKGKGGYVGSIRKTFKINPKKTKLKRPIAAKRAITVKWKKQAAKMANSRITGYQIQVATNKAFTKNKKTIKVSGYSKTSKVVKGLKENKKYYIHIRTGVVTFKCSR